MKDSFINF